MKKQDFLNTLAERSGIDATKIVEIINSENEDIDIELSNVNLFTDDELTDKLKNHVSISKPTLIEMEIKNARNDFELEFEGKTMKNLVNAAIEKGKAEAGIKPNEKIKEQESIIQKLKSNIDQLENDFNSKLTAREKEVNNLKADYLIQNMIPDGLDTPLSKKDITTLFKAENTVKNEDGKMVFADINGEIYRNDKTLNILDSKDVVNNWLANKGIKMKSTNGRGLGNDNGKNIGKTKLGNISNSDEFYKYCKENDIPDRDRYKLIPQIQEENPDFVLE